MNFGGNLLPYYFFTGQQPRWAFKFLCCQEQQLTLNGSHLYVNCTLFSTVALK